MLKMGELINLDNISLNLGGRNILKNISLNINEEEFITIIGPNGAGKSMLLKVIVGLIKPTIGQVKLSRKVKFGYTPQRINTNNTLPIKVCDFLRLKKQADKDEIDKVIEDTSISKFLDMQLSHLSGGEMQNILLARSLIDKPDILILDEPAQNLDLSSQIYFYKLLDRIYESYKIGIFMVSHDLHFVMSSSNQVICLYHHICCKGHPRKVAKDPEFASLFGADMTDIMSIYHHSHDHSHVITDGDVDSNRDIRNLEN